MKTAETIEASEARKQQTANHGRAPERGVKRGPYKQGTHPNSHVRPKRVQPPQLAPYLWQKGQSGNPSGGSSSKPKSDVANRIARAVFENNEELLYDTFARAMLKGNAYAFTQLADRAYGKIADKLELGPGAEYRDMNTEALAERVKHLERKLGVTISADDARGTGITPVRNLPPIITPKD